MNMKKNIVRFLIFRFRVALIPILGLLLITLPGTVFAQEDSNAKKTEDTTTQKEEPAVAEVEMISPSITFTGVQKSDKTIDLKASMQAKVNGQFIRLYKMKIRFAEVVNEEDRDLGFVITDGRGKAVLNIKADSLKPDAEGKLNFKAIFAGNQAMEAAEETVSFKPASLEITPVKEDSVMTVNVKLSAGDGTPVKEATVGIFVKRSFLPLKVGEVTTDESGEASFEFPANLPGDANGNLTILGKLDESEDYGNLEAASVQPWGMAVSNKLQQLPRALWSTHPPLWMLITFIVLMVTVWGHYFVIVYELFRLRKEQPHATN